MSHEREEFEKFVLTRRKLTEEQKGELPFAIWQAATAAADARYQARIKELEEALRNLLQDTQHSEHNCYSNECPVVKARQTLSTTSDTALQRALLEARIDELDNDCGSQHWARLEELRAQLAALKGESIESEKEDVREPCPVCFIRECNGECLGE